MEQTTQYRQLQPEDRMTMASMRQQGVQWHLETWLAHGREGHDDAGPVPPYVEREFPAR